MRSVKPITASLLTRSFEFRRRQYLGVSVLLFSPLGDVPELLLEQAMWQFWGGRPEAGAPLEESFPRRRGEYLVCGSAYPDPRFERHAGCAVRAEFGKLRKELIVHGPRYWQGQQATPAQPFSALPLSWAHSYGGADFPENPLGMGRVDSEINGVTVRLLPQIEAPDAPLLAPDSVGRPAGFGPLDQMWPQRARYRGSYDDRWFKEEFPGIAGDTDWRFFNSAPQDQQQDETFIGDERYAFDNLHPSIPRLEGRLPGLATRVFATRRSALEATFEEVVMRLTSLWFFPDAERVIQIYQGVLEVSEDDAADVTHLLTAIEKIGECRTPEHYRAVRDKRMDPVDGALESLREEDLVPADLVVPFGDFTRTENRGLDRAMKRAESDRQAARDLVVANGLDPELHAPPVKYPPPPEIKSIDDLIALRRKMESEAAELPARMAAEKKKTMDELRQVFAREQLDFSVIERETQGLATRGPPKPAADGLMADFRKLIEQGRRQDGDVRELEQMLADPAIVGRWQQADRDQLSAYRSMAQHQVPLDVLAGEAAAALRQEVATLYAQGASFAGRDLSGADLSGMDLHGADFSEALLESANLCGSNLNGVNLSAAVLAHAQLAGTQLEAATLVRCNLSGSRLDGACLRGADLRDALFDKAVLRNADLRQTRLDGVRLEGARLEAVDFSGAQSESMLLIRSSDLRGSKFVGALFKQCVFQACELGGVDFSGARIDKVAFVAISAEAAVFRKVHIGSGCFAMACNLTRADFSGAHMSEMSFRGSVLCGANFTGCCLRNSDLSECDLRGALFYAADARGARLVRADLRQADLASSNLANAVLQHARLEQTDFRQANLYESDFARVFIGAEVQLAGALTTRARTQPRREPSPAPVPSAPPPGQTL